MLCHTTVKKVLLESVCHCHVLSKQVIVSLRQPEIESFVSDSSSLGHTAKEEPSEDGVVVSTVMPCFPAQAAEA